MITMVGPHDKKKFIEKKGTTLLDVTSHSTTWTKAFSPFFLGPCKLYGAYGAFNVENAWQYAKVYKQHLDTNGDPNAEYYAWAMRGWGKKRAERYPMGKGAVPAYSYWDGQKLGYVEAKRQIYIPLYERAVQDANILHGLIADVRRFQSAGLEVGFFDFDVFDNVKEKMTFEQVLNSNRKLGHAFVLANMIEREIKNGR